MKIKKKCLRCGQEFYTIPSVIKAGNGKFCSNDCFYKYRRQDTIVKCKTCGKEFYVRPCIEEGRGKYCSQICYRKKPSIKIKRKCLQCGKEFFIIPAKVKLGYGKYCSQKCHSKSRKDNRKRFICPVCGEEFVRASKISKFCSKECKSKRNKVKVICETCGKEFEVLPFFTKKRKRRFCSIECSGKSMRGSNNLFWKEEGVRYSALHAWVRRNKPKPLACKTCGKTTTKLYAANISGEYKRDLDDFIYLCGPCHDQFDKQKNKYPNKDPELIIEELKEANK